MPQQKEDGSNNNTKDMSEYKKLTKSSLQFVCQDYYKNFFYNLNQQKTLENFCDVDILVGNDIIKAHRIVLSSSSPYFEAMFRPNLGLIENTQKSVTLHSISPEILRMLIDFIYTGTIEIDQINVQELLAAADMLGITAVVSVCCEFLCRELHPSNALGILRFSEAHHCEQLASSALSFVYSNFPQISEEDEILDVPQALLSRLVSSESIRVDTEFQVFQAALRWINHDVVSRRRFVFEILGHVRLALIPVRLIDSAINECRDMSLKIALRSVRKDLTGKRGQLTPLRIDPRLGAKKSIYIIGGSKRETTSGWTNDLTLESVIKYDIFKGEWSESKPMNLARILPGVCSLGGKIFVFGGERGSQILANGEVFDPINNTWTMMPAMTIPRCEFGLCAIGGTLYAIGGWVGEDIGGSIECYDPIKNSWNVLGDLPEPRFSMGVVSFEGLIYIVGGCTTSSRHLPDLISYNPINKEWTPLAPMTTARCQMGVTILGREMYIVGGNSSNQEVLRTVEKYSFDDNKWTVVASMSVPRASPAVASADGLLWVAGGDVTCEVNFYRAQITINSFECYSPFADSWENCKDLPSSRSEAGAVVL